LVAADAGAPNALSDRSGDAPFARQRTDMALDDGRGGDGRDVGVIVGRGQLDHVHAAPVEFADAAQDGVRLARGEAARDRRAGAGGEGGIEAVDIEAQVGGADGHRGLPRPFIGSISCLNHAVSTAAKLDDDECRDLVPRGMSRLK
jgi:hypothetical protein